jgi:hypothetical protein
VIGAVNNFAQSDSIQALGMFPASLQYIILAD